MWTDNNWGENIENSKLTDYYVVIVVESFVAWKFVKQTSVTFSSIENKYIKHTLIATNIMWAKVLLSNLHINGFISFNFITIFADNQNVITLANNQIFQKRFKHIIVKYHYIENLIKRKEIDLIYKFTGEIIANNFYEIFKTSDFCKIYENVRVNKIEIYG